MVQLTQKQKERFIVVSKIFGISTVLLPLVALIFLPELRSELLTGIKILSAGDLDGLHAWAAQFGWRAPFATTLLMVAQALAAPIPAVLVTWTNSLLFGWFPGGCLSILSATFAASICYWLGRAVGMPLANKLVSKETLERWDKSTNRYGANTILVARLLPFVPFDPISYIAGIVRMRFWPFFTMTLLGQIPAGFAYSYLGAQITQPAKLVISGICVVAGLVAIGLMAKRFFSSPR